MIYTVQRHIIPSKYPKVREMHNALPQGRGSGSVFAQSQKVVVLRDTLKIGSQKWCPFVTPHFEPEPAPPPCKFNWLPPQASCEGCHPCSLPDPPPYPAHPSPSSSLPPLGLPAALMYALLSL